MHKEEGQLKLEVVTPVTIDERFIDRYSHLWHLGSLALFEEERYRILESRGVGADIIQSQFGLRVLVSKIKDVEYREVHLGDNVEIRSLLDNTPAIMLINHEMLKQGLVAVKGSYVLGFIDAQGKPRRIPNKILESLYG